MADKCDIAAFIHTKHQTRNTKHQPLDEFDFFYEFITIKRLKKSRGNFCSAAIIRFDKKTAVFEVVKISESLKTALQPHMSADKIRALIRSEKNVLSLRHCAFRKAIAGQTSLAEIVRITTK